MLFFDSFQKYISGAIKHEFQELHSQIYQIVHTEIIIQNILPCKTNSSSERQSERGSENKKKSS